MTIQVQKHFTLITSDKIGLKIEPKEMIYQIRIRIDQI
jgi:hypothetical protein